MVEGAGLNKNENLCFIFHLDSGPPGSHLGHTHLLAIRHMLIMTILAFVTEDEINGVQ